MLVVVVSLLFDRFRRDKKRATHLSLTCSLHSVTSLSRACSSPELSSSERAAAWAAEDKKEEDEATFILFAPFGAAEARGSIAVPQIQMRQVVFFIARECCEASLGWRGRASW